MNSTLSSGLSWTHVPSRVAVTKIHTVVTITIKTASRTLRDCQTKVVNIITCCEAYIVDREIFAVKFSSMTFTTKIKHAKYLCNIRRPIPILVAKVRRRNLDYAKNLLAKYFNGENILIYGTYSCTLPCGRYTQNVLCT